ncbi:hypothetical protein MMC09_001369 [Bachmanniomyces sp. S44760]|nr:hypothetical protein [Bachmanniomyces sp. S44760]
MASLADAPYLPPNVQGVTSVIRQLEAGTKSGGGPRKGRDGYTCKKQTYEVAGSGGISVDSWRFSDWDYKRDDLPTYARGLFTYRKKDGTPAIAARGYDKFFNVEEVNDTRWRNVEERTRGPYELSVKENGCIIFICGLEGGVLLVCSKHSTGYRNGEVSHANAGEKWVDRHLQTIGKTRKDLAVELYDRNITAVAELCDDSFEEHVLAYDEKSAGLYVHGINLNVPEFATYPAELVHAFGDTWGFKKADYLIKDNLQSVKAFLDECAETGSYDGRDTEGFVIRCNRLEKSTNTYNNWFFKYKFEEPYLMYRQWREMTKAAISGKIFKPRKHQKISAEYLLYARRQLARNSSLAKAYQNNHGIIEMREGFLRERGLQGSDIIRQENEGQDHDQESDDVTNDVVLVPVATIGCGKTTVAVALTKLYGWGHVQNDNITGKKNRPQQFVTQICNSLTSSPVVIADRNNHQRRERLQLIDDVSRVMKGARYVALHYVHTPKNEMLPDIRRITQRRVLERGDNHQTIQADTQSPQVIQGIMDGFLNRFEAVNKDTHPDDEFDEIINLDPCVSSRENLEVVIRHLHNAYPKLVTQIPSPNEMDDAFHAAMNEYKPDIKHDLSFASKNKDKDTEKLKGKGPKGGQHNQQTAPHTQPKPPAVEYFAIHIPTHNIFSILESMVQGSSDAEYSASAFYSQLRESSRIQKSFHVTLIHRANKPQRPDLWNQLTSLYAATQMEQNDNQGQVAEENKSLQPSRTNTRPLAYVPITLTNLIFDFSIMAFTAKIGTDSASQNTIPGDELGADFWAKACVNTIPHITVGTKDPRIKPKESNRMLERWYTMGKPESQDGIHCVSLGSQGIQLNGEVRAVLQGGWS